MDHQQRTDLECQAFEAAGNNIRQICSMYDCERAAVIFRGYARAFLSSYGALVGSRIAAELAYKMGDAEVSAGLFDADIAAIVNRVAKGRAA